MFLEVLERLMKEKNINLNQLSKLSGVPYMTLKNFWNQGCDNIKLTTLRKLADFFGVSLDYLISGESRELTESEYVIVDNYKKLNVLGKQKATDYIKDLSEQEKYTKNLPRDEEQKYEGMRLAAFGGDMKGTPKKKKVRLSPQQ